MKTKQLYIIGMGPGDIQQMTPKAMDILKHCDMIAGYTVYIELLRPYFPEKELLSTPMRQEEARCLMALKAADSGKNIAVVCSGDAGVYGMAGLLYELSPSFPEVELCIIPGITAALSGAALLGAPLMHDFCTISLSDLMTPWKTIEKRLIAAAQADFVLCLYNPSSKKRHDYLKKACDILLSCRRPDTVCGIVRNIARKGEEALIINLAKLRTYQADMFTTVFIGNSETKNIKGHMVTPRGYFQNYDSLL